ncbi:NERD domain-containing protein/DEAD/DEAH box helicase [Rhizobium brockwellii]|uniref:NERD domain-containing protein/DEAD/DEAH box helicase n=1 Tax=Rhizobium brockwellii TaxID=3019932 RepID=A0ABU3YHR6_9HYPH|nr:NERD domain-containing protein/DEAD/DEAH box helicase [Rhizobium brockwellii]MDV4178402.1 NERD domain-containing protein/DEAD/DEAH box helicase [Rhizobium brockwellii]MDV4185401.1 NERD domain-containing protein/DEAD/DEAH box helicase [Rhizobium brockwellii]
MAILIPDVPKDCPNSERHVYERLGRELPDDWIVLHSLGLPTHGSKIWGEADIVVLSTIGVFSLEVKGGTVDCADGVWSFGGDFNSYSKRESPWSQAMGALGAIRDRLRSANSAFRQVLFGYGVVMPYTTFTASGAEILQDVLLDRRHFREPLGSYMRSLERYWSAELQNKHGRAYRGLTPAELRDARQILRPDLETALSIGSYLTGVESRLVHLTNEQIRASRRMAANPRTVVRGPAGTGKSVIAIDRCRQLASDGHKVLYLCFNQLLAAHIRSGAGTDLPAGALEARHVHALYRDIIAGAGLLDRLASQDDSSQDFFAFRFPEIAAEALCEQTFDSWDVLVVDEAQDILTPQHLDVLDLLLKDGLRRGRWHFFLDPQQNIYKGDVEAQVDGRLAEGAPAFDDLFENCRNTRQVAVQASIVSGVDLAVTGAPDGPDSEIRYYSSHEDAFASLEKLLRDLIDADVRPEDIAILSTRKHQNSLLAGRHELAGRRLFDPISMGQSKSGEILFTTMHAFKGLERQTIIAVDMEETGQDTWSMLHYAGLSRARCLLYIFLPSSANRAYERQAEAFGMRLKGRLT